MTKIYSGFFNGTHHITHQFAPGNCKLPVGVFEGDSIDFYILGTYQADGFLGLVIQGHQPNGTPYHITQKVPDGVPPVEMGRQIMAHPENIIKTTGPEVITLVAGFHRA